MPEPPRPARFAEFDPDGGRTRWTAADGLQVRRAEPADLRRMAEIAARRHSDDPEVRFANLTRELERAGHESGPFLWVAAVDGIVAGFARASHFEPPPDARPGCAPPGWYLVGLQVDAEVRRHGIGTALTRVRLDWIGERGADAFFFTNARNLASIELHRRLGFVEVTRSFWFPGVEFSGDGVGILFRRRPADDPGGTARHSDEPAGPASGGH